MRSSRSIGRHPACPWPRFTSTQRTYSGFEDLEIYATDAWTHYGGPYFLNGSTVTSTLLEGLVFDTGSLSPAFSPEIKSYTLTVPYGTTSVSVTAASPSGTSMNLSQNGVWTTGWAGQSDVAVENFPVQVKTVLDGRGQTYSINIEVEHSSNANLSNLTLSQGTLSPTFSAGTTSYTATVPAEVVDVDFTATVADALATLKVDGTDVASGNSHLVTLSYGDNPIAVEVRAEDGTVKQYTITVTRAPATVATLSSLSSEAGTLSPAFSADTTSYALTVDEDVDSLTLRAIPTDGLAITTINGVQVEYGSTSAPIPLAVGSNPIEVVVTAMDGTTRLTYTVDAVRAASSNATLADLRISEGALSRTFDASTLNYDAAVGYDVTSLQVTPTVADATAAVTVNGVAVLSGQASAPIALSVGENPVDVAVTAPDGTTLLLYKVVVTRRPSANAELASLVFENATLDPGFDPNLTHYTATVPGGVSAEFVTVTPASDVAKVSINGSVAQSGHPFGPIPLVVGENLVEVMVTAQSGHQYLYKVLLDRAVSTDAGLLDITSTAGGLEFDPAIGTYRIDVAADVSAIGFTATAHEARTTIAIDGVTVPSGEASPPIDLVAGQNKVLVVATAEDGRTTSSYLIEVWRAASSDATIEEIGISQQTGTLTPPFSPEHTTYTMSVPHRTASISLAPIAANSGAKMEVRVNGEQILSSQLSALTGDASATPAPQVLNAPLRVGENLIEVLVTAQNGSTLKAYSITVMRAAAADAALAGLSVSAGELTPAFTPGTTAYRVDVDPGVAAMSVTSVTRDAGATVAVNGKAVASGLASAPIPLENGATLISVVVTAEDGTTQRSYELEVRREGAIEREFEEHEGEIRDIVRNQTLLGTRARLAHSERFSRDARNRFIDRMRSRAAGEVARGRSVGWTGSLAANGSRIDAEGSLSVERQAGAWTRLFFGEFDVSGDGEGAVVGTFSARLAQERMVSDRALVGVYVGADFTQGEVSAGFDGDSSSAHLSFGTYGVAQLDEALWLDGFASFGMGENALNLERETLALDGEYRTRSLLFGAALTGSREFEGFELRPRLALSHGTTRIGDVPFEAAAFGKTEDVSLDAGVVSITRLEVTPEIRVPFSRGGDKAEGTFAPRVVCEWTDGAERDNACGGGVELGFGSWTENGLTRFSGNVLVEKVGASRRASLGVNFTHRF